METTSPWSSPPRQCEKIKDVLKALRMPDLARRDSIGLSCCDWKDILSCSNLDHVTELRLAGQQLTGTIPFALFELPELEVLDLSNNTLTGTIPKELFSLRNLRKLSISSGGLSGDLPSGLKNLRKLQALDLSANNLSGGLQELAESQHLVELRLADNNLSGPIDLPWAKLSKLRILHLGRNKFSGPIPIDIGSAGTLEQLDLSGNTLTGSLPESLADFKSLSVLKLNNNQLSGPIPVQLPAVKDTCVLVTSSSGGSKDGNNFECVLPNINNATSAPSNKCLTSLPTRNSKPFPTCGATSSKADEPAAESGFPMAAVIAIVCGVLVLLGIFLFVLVRRRRRQKAQHLLKEKPIAPKHSHATSSTPFSESSHAVVGNRTRISFLVDANGNRHSVHIPSQAHVIDGSQLIMLPQPSYQGHVQAQGQAGGLAQPSYMSTHSDPSSLASGGGVANQQRAVYMVSPSVVGAAQAHQQTAVPPMPHFFPNEVVYLGDNPRPSISTAATTTATTATSEAAVVVHAKQAVENDDSVKEAVAEQSVSMVTVNVPDGYTVSLVPINRPQTPASTTGP
ncbi:hypothetical protein BCR44DRAFT_78729 [Catenaria anguillulae PL171]|uniref:Leucine-rich repeat-containing N-terminal plant-type domain-containing protein n=1 Tax=Catenaria anguillulae PL171 TaxID=765915 RepID=A0A1Y2H9A3_9FUNG|nr:hypothetical protein BCR44DRAFT_78729 [Catenaria anguillulae PL171]